MVPRYRLTLDSDERPQLFASTRISKAPARLFRNARALLLCDQGPEGPGWTVGRTAEALGVSSRTIEHLKRRFVQEGLEAALSREPSPRKPRAVTFDGEFEARWVELARSPAPAGLRRWAVRLLAKKAVGLGLAPRVSAMTVHRMLRKANCALVEGKRT